MKKEKSSINELKKNLKEAQEKKEEYLKGWQRTTADFLNYKKEKVHEEVRREREKMEEALKEKWLRKILTILDNFEKAEKEIPENLKNDQYLKGFPKIKTQILDFLKNEGVTEIKLEGELNPDLHEVVDFVERTELKKNEKGDVIEEIQRGYMIGNKLLRVTKVRVIKIKNNN